MTLINELIDRKIHPITGHRFTSKYATVNYKVDTEKKRIYDQNYKAKKKLKND